MTNFEGGARVEKTHFLVKIFQKVSRNAFFGLFLKKFDCGAESFLQNRVLLLIYESSENQMSRPKKKGQENFRKTPPPPRKTSAHATEHKYCFSKVMR